MTRNPDSIIIGSGQAWPFLAVRLAGVGQTVALIERRVLGGTCVSTGCTPTKQQSEACQLLDAIPWIGSRDSR